MGREKTSGSNGQLLKSGSKTKEPQGREVSGSYPVLWLAVCLFGISAFEMVASAIKG